MTDWKVSKIRNKTRVPTIIIPVQHHSGSPSQTKWVRKIIGIQIRKGKVKLFVDDMILYTEIPRLHQNLLE